MAPGPDARRWLTGRAFAQALGAAGIVTDLDSVERIVIDIRSDRLVEIHVVRIGDERLLAGFADMLTMDAAGPDEAVA